MTTVAQTPAATTSAGSPWQIGNQLLSQGLNTWLQVEQVKAARASSGQDQQIAKYKPELETATAVQVDAAQRPVPEQGIKINQPILFASLGLLGIALLMAKNKS